MQAVGLINAMKGGDCALEVRGGSGVDAACGFPFIHFSLVDAKGEEGIDGHCLLPLLLSCRYFLALKEDMKTINSIYSTT